MIDASNSPKVDLVVTGDGSHTLKLKDVDEHYHSTHGAIEESQFIFIQNGLELFKERQAVRILEIGFGTGVNALLSGMWSRSNDVLLEYTALEPFPLSTEVLASLNYSELLGAGAKEIFNSIHENSWEELGQVSSHFLLIKTMRSASDLNELDAFDLVYFDAFSPATQPEMWTIDVFQKMFNACASGAVLVTYCAKGQVRRDLMAVGFEVERLPGPPAKRHILRATKP